MTLTRPWAIDAAFPNAADQRKQLASIYPREGIFPDPITTAQAGIAYAGSGWAIGARAFGAVLKRGGAPFSQTYGSALISNDGSVANAWTIGAAPAAGSRIDLLCIRARDTTQGDSASGAPTDGPGGLARTGLPEFVVVAGTAGTPGVRPALPAGYEEIAEVTTPSGAASAAGSTIKQTYAFAHVPGGPIYVRTNAERDALTGLIEGDIVVVIDQANNRHFRGTRRGASWDMDTAWTDFIFANSWGNFGGEFQTARYRKINGEVQIQGTIKNGAQAQTMLFNPLPAGMRPAKTLPFIVPANAGVAELRVYADGGMTIQSYYAGGSNAIVSINVSFSPET